MSLSVGPLCTSLISAWFKYAVSKHSCTFPLSLGTRTKLLQQLQDSLTQGDTMTSCFCNISSSSLKGYCSAYTTHLCRVQYGLLPSLICKVNIPSK